ncbi:solute carrier family 25 member 48 [Orycteropus afer afer]|uniref:Solute carrier family 25 member 48 n=1 Tax=Orycteropus afer afer TaxID=1230840 RepID=A0AC54Z789_ORYAF|nr:solute carrier family 25 member 48 [Orycteropus afer afer]
MGSFQLEDFAAGWIGGAASVLVGHPLDTVKAECRGNEGTTAVVQVRDDGGQDQGGMVVETRLQAGVGYRNTLSCIRMVYKKESVFGFFKGMSFPLASIAVYNAVVFGVFSNTQRFLSQHRCRDLEASPSSTLSDLLLASMVAGVVSVGLGGPVDLIKIRLQMQTQSFRGANLHLKPRAVALGEQPVYHGPVHCMATIVRNEGLLGLYRGASAMLLRDVPGYCLYFIPYVFLNEWITPEACAGPSPCAVWLAGGLAGAISWGTATPMDVVKSRLQADGVYFSKYKGVLDCISQSYQQEGLKVFFRGITVNAVRGFPMSAAMFLGYELSLQAIRGDHTATDP